MTTLKTHAESSRTALGYPPEWVAGLAQRIGEEVPFGPSLALTSVDVERLLKCVGLWKSERLLAITTPLPVEGRFTRLTRSLVRRWFASLRDGVGIRPFEFVEWSLNDYDEMPTDVLEWVGPQSREERMETVGEIAAIIARFAEQIGYPQLPSGVVLSPEMSVRIDDLTLSARDVDLVIGAGETRDGIYWPGAVLVGFVHDTPTAEDLDRLAYSSFIYSLRYGGPPARAVSYGLVSGKSLSMDVERDWVEMAVGGILAVLPKLVELMNGADEVLTPGDHCEGCPDRGNCPFTLPDSMRDW